MAEVVRQDVGVSNDVKDKVRVVVVDHVDEGMGMLWLYVQCLPLSVSWCHLIGYQDGGCVEVDVFQVLMQPFQPVVGCL
eukprot:6484057-Amphidinium_carterae.1